MIIDCISDLHGYYPELEGGDLLIVAGDLTARDTADEWGHYFLWQGDMPYKKIIFISGNHDNRMQNVDMAFYSPYGKVDYLCDSGTEFEGLKIWGSPWTKSFEGMNPHCKAFTVETEEELDEKWQLIPNDIDILITHSPPYGILDGLPMEDGSLFHVGSESLVNKICQMENRPKLWVWGHIHEAYGFDLAIRGKPCIMVNASHVNEYYWPINKPVRIIL